MGRQACRHAMVLALCASVAALAVSSGNAHAEVNVEKTKHGATVTIDGQPFAEYLTKSGHQPAVWPIVGPGGQAMTRSFPLGPLLPGEPDDHPHHRSLWFTHGSVNGEDFWLEPEAREEGAKDNQIVHREFVDVGMQDGAARIVTCNDWTSDGAKVCEDERTLLFGADELGRWIDFTVVVTASEGPLVFGDTKEGAFGVRVPGTMAVDAEKGGQIRNSRGQDDAVAWGQAAEWVDYRGTVGGKPAGITVFELPDSFRHPTRWHVRTYGLFAANPFGERDFVADAGKKTEGAQGEAKLAKGEKLRLHYRVLFHTGELTKSQLAQAFKKYSAEAGKKED